MDPLSILSSIWDAKNKLKEFVATVKANKKQCRTLWERIDAMTPKLRQLEVQQQAIKDAHAKSADKLKPCPYDSTLVRQLSTLLQYIDDAANKVAEFSGKSSFSRLWNRS